MMSFSCFRQSTTSIIDLFRLEHEHVMYISYNRLMPFVFIHFICLIQVFCIKVNALILPYMSHVLPATNFKFYSVVDVKQ